MSKHNAMKTKAKIETASQLENLQVILRKPDDLKPWEEIPASTATNRLWP